MPKGNQNIPIDAYDPRFKELLIRGGKERIELQLKSWKEVCSLYNQLQHFRARCRNENRDGWQTLYRAKVVRVRDKNMVTVFPRGSEFGNALDNIAGEAVEAPKLPVDPLDELS